MANKLSKLGDATGNNWGLKLLAIIAGVLTFYGIRGVTSEQATFDIPVVVEVPEGIAILDQNPRTVLVTFRGSRDDLMRLDRKQVKAVVQAKVSDPGSAESELVRIGLRDIDGAIGVRADKIQPEMVNLVFDSEDTKEFPIASPQIDRTPLIGRAEIESFEPRVVTVRGSHRQLKLMLEDGLALKTEPVDVDGRVASFSKLVPVLSPGDTGVFEIRPAEVTVKVNIITEMVSRQWTNVSVLGVVRQGDLIDLTIQPSVVNVVLDGRPEVLEEMADDAVKVFVDCVDLPLGATNQLPVNVHLTTGADVTAMVTPEEVQVTVNNGKRGKRR